MEMENTDFRMFPKFRHNLWTTYEDDPEITYLTLSHGTFEVSTQDVSRFLKIRSFCTGHNTVADIAEKSSMPDQEVLSIVNSMQEIDAFHLPCKPLQTLSKEEIVYTLEAATNIWAEQLADTYISRDIFAGKTSKNVVLGWLLETYHYVKLFPTALEIA